MRAPASQPAKPQPKVEPFRVTVPEADLLDLQARLERTRWSPEFGNDDWDYGTNGRYLRELVAYWRTDYDWRSQEAEINRYRHFRVTLDDVPIHYIHEPGRGPNPIPLIVTHGWPWTFWDWHQVIGPLTDPAAHGLDPGICFDLVVASLPGFTFSTPLTTTGVTPTEIAALWNRIMRDVLGYDRYGAAGGDWGAVVSAELGHARDPGVRGVYLSLPPVGRTGGMYSRRAEEYAPGEAGWFERCLPKWATTTSHVAVQSADPQTLAWALEDSPVGLAAWLLERRFNWCDGPMDAVFDRDFLLTTICLYWFTRSIGSSMRIYAESFPAGRRTPPERLAGPVAPDVVPRPERISARTGVGVFLGDVALLPRAVVESVTNLDFWSVHEVGGHFGPSEQPSAYVTDLRTFFGPGGPTTAGSRLLEADRQ